MPGYFEEDGHRAMLNAEDPIDISFEPQQSGTKHKLKRSKVTRANQIQPETVQQENIVWNDLSTNKHYVLKSGYAILFYHM